MPSTLLKAFAFLLLITFLFSCQNEKSETLRADLIPFPDDVAEISGVSMIDQLSFDVDLVEGLSALQPWFDSESTAVNNNLTNNTTLVLNTNLKDGSYILRLGKREIIIEHGSIEGIRNAIVTTTQLYEMNNGKLPITTIQDFNRFGYKGMHLDVGRHFFTPDEIKKYIDYLVFYKMNRFHWHLTEDQGWRIEIKQYPRLQEVAACRKETLVGHLGDANPKFDGKEYCGYYTQDEIKDIVAYASARGIEVIPEIDLPGHSTALLAAYPDLGCVKKRYETATSWGVKEDVLCPKEETFTFLQNVFDEVLELFPSEYIHIGGDECPKLQWEKSALCQRIIAENDLGDENGLQSYFIGRVASYIQSKGRHVIGWDEILEGGLAKDAIVMSWRGEAGGIEAAHLEHEVVMTPNTYCYFDYYQSNNPDEPLAIGGFLPVQQVYSWDVVPPSLSEEEGKYILGGQGNVWTEYISDFSYLEYMMMARMITLSEVLWGKNSNTFQNFAETFQKHITYWKGKGANIANHLGDISLDYARGEDNSIVAHMNRLVPEVNFLFKSPDSSNLVSLPSGEIPLSTPGLYEFSGEYQGESGYPIKINFEPHLATYADVAFITTPSPKYSGFWTLSLVNGVEGTKTPTKDKEWLGFDEKDASVEISFDGDTDLSQISARFYDNRNSWIWSPSEVLIEVLDAEGETITKEEIKNLPSADSDGYVNFNAKLSAKNGKKIKFTAKNHGIIPEGYPGSGKAPWLFLGEIRVE